MSCLALVAVWVGGFVLLIMFFFGALILEAAQTAP
jgi:hypothetical protein